MPCKVSLYESSAESTESTTVASILDKFADDTSAHAIPQIISNPRIVAKVVWSVLVTISFVIFCVQASDLLSRFHTFHTNIELVNSEYVEFPAVTICNVNRMRRSKVTENSRYQDVAKLENKQFLENYIDDLAFYDWLWSSDYWTEVSPDTQLQNPDIAEPQQQTFISADSQKQLNSDSDFPTADFRHDYPESVERSIGNRWIFSSDSLFDYWDYSYGLEWSSFIELFNKLGDDFASKILEIVAPTKDELRTMGHQAKDFILQCNFNKAKCDHRNFTTFQNKQYGNCFTFNISKHGRQYGRVTQVGSEYGLHLTLFIEKPQYVGLFTEQSGARIVIHPKNVFPHPEDVGISISPGFATSIGLRQVEMKRLGGRYGECIEGKSKNHLSSDRYNYSIISCQKKCLLDHMKKKCGCVTNIYDDYTNVPNCKDEGIENSQVRCQQQVERNFLTKKLKCNCPAPCHEYIYNTKLSSTIWPSEVYQPHLRDKLQEENISAYRVLSSTKISRENLVRLSIYFEELNYELIEQVPAYSVPSVLGNLGGLLGLYLGFSVLTICEVVILFYHLTIHAIGKVKTSINKLGKV